MDIPINAAKAIADQYDWPIVIIIASTPDGQAQHVTTYGRSPLDSLNAANGGNHLKQCLGWPDELCQAQPAERVCSNCHYFHRDRWCMVQPQRVERYPDAPACIFFHGRNWGEGTTEP